MHPLTEPDIRNSFINASRREAAQATLPDLARVPWDRLDYLGWTDAKRPGTSYVALEVAGETRGVALRRSSPTGVRRKAMCAWCEDITATDNVTMFVAKRAGAAGRRGNTVGTLICAEFTCSRNVRRAPLVVEMGANASPEEREFWTALRIEELRAKATRFFAAVMREG